MSTFSKIAFIGAVSAVASAPAIAGPYANVESRSAYLGDQRQSTVTDVHLGYQTSLHDQVTLSVQAGPAFVAVEGADTEHEISGLVAISADLTEKLNLYGEVSAITIQRSIEDDFPIGVEVGATYTF